MLLRMLSACALGIGYLINPIARSGQDQDPSDETIVDVNPGFNFKIWQCLFLGLVCHWIKVTSTIWLDQATKQKAPNNFSTTCMTCLLCLLMTMMLD